MILFFFSLVLSMFIVMPTRKNSLEGGTLGAGLSSTLKKAGKVALATGAIGAAAVAGQKLGLDKFVAEKIGDVGTSLQFQGALRQAEKGIGSLLGGGLAGEIKRTGTKKEVHTGQAKRTSGGLTKKDLIINKRGKIVSRRMSESAKKRGGSKEQMAKMRALRGKKS